MVCTATSRGGHSSPGDGAARALEGHAPVGQVPHYAPQRAEPLGAEDDVVLGQGHDVEVRRERRTVDEQRRVADDAYTRDPLAVGDHGREAWPLAKRQACPTRSLLGDEVMGAAGVEKGDERGSPYCHCQLHGVSHGHAGHGLQ
jgi:hypothetical protein